MGLAALVPLALAASATAGPLDWMVGSWCAQPDETVRVCEHWQPRSGGMMLGTNQTVQADSTQGFEFMRVDWEGETARFHAYPGGRFGGTFGQIEQGTRRIVFANAAHDYPQRIAYWREDDALLAEISLADGSRAMRWRFRPETKD
jgi:hypothetical protein